MSYLRPPGTFQATSPRPPQPRETPLEQMVATSWEPGQEPASSLCGIETFLTLYGSHGDPDIAPNLRIA
jgi:hypothetical protein